MASTTENIGCVGSTIATGSGRYFDYSNPTVDQIEIDCIAQALSNICRFGGHCRFYSVAEHSIHCCDLAKAKQPKDFEFQFAALMHDAAEAYTGDMCKPLKIIMPEFREMESAIEAVVFAKFKVDESYKSAVKEIDLQMLKAEKEYLFPKNRFDMWTGFESIQNVDVHIKCFYPTVSMLHFLNRFHELQSKRAAQ